MKSPRLDWIDIAKAIGIICVVMGHVTGLVYTLSHTFIYLFHMPLFFFIGGYLSKPNSNFKEYFKKKSSYLLIPYLSFLIILFIPQEAYAILMIPDETLLKGIGRFFLGGKLLGGFATVFWFVTVFFAAQQVFNFLIIKCKTSLFVLLMLVSLGVAYTNQFLFPDLFVPLNLNVAFYALPIFYMGYLYRLYLEKLLDENIYRVLGIILFIVIAILSYSLSETPIAQVDLMFAKYGIPILSLMLGLIVIYGLIVISKLLAKTTIKIPLAYIGKASMCIMFLHQTIQIVLDTFFKVGEIRIIPAILIPIFCYYIFNKFAITRFLLLDSGSLRK